MVVQPDYDRTRVSDRWPSSSAATDLYWQIAYSMAGALQSGGVGWEGEVQCGHAWPQEEAKDIPYQHASEVAYPSRYHHIYCLKNFLRMIQKIMCHCGGEEGLERIPSLGSSWVHSRRWIRRNRQWRYSYLYPSGQSGYQCRDMCPLLTLHWDASNLCRSVMSHISW